MTTEINNPTYNFVNGVASLKDDCLNRPLDEASLRATRVFGKLMLTKGTKFDPTNHKMVQFLLSTSEKYIKAELFIIGSRGQIITDQRVFLNVAKENIAIQQGPNFWFVELIHPSVDVDACAIVEFK